MSSTILQLQLVALVLAMVVATVTVVGQVPAESKSESHTITNAQFTNWGTWGPFDQCPFGTFAFGYQLKVAPYDPAADNTALNGIRLLCALPAEEIEYVEQITSSEGSFGTWSPVLNCSGDPLTGFVLEAVPNKGSNLRLWKSDVDDVAAIAFRGYSARDKVCKHDKVKDYEDAGGIWAPSVYCDEGFVICGIRTQIDEAGSDKTGLNNVVFRCCDH